MLSGVTTVVDHHFLNRHNGLAESTVLGLRDVGVRAIVARATMDTGVGLPDSIKESPARAFEAVDDLLRGFAKEIAAGDVRIMTGPNTPGINATAQAVRDIVEFARDRQIGISSHVAEYAEVRAAVARNYRVDGVVRWLSALDALGPDLLAVHAVHVDREEIPILHECDVAVSHNPFSNLFCGPRTAPASEYVAAGLRVGLGTDGAANNNGLDIFDAARITRILERANPDRPGITALQTLSLATRGGADALRMSGEIGTLAVGKRADLVLLSTRSPHMMPMFDPVAHLGYFGKGSDVDTVLIGGQVTVRAGSLVNLDLEDLRREVGSAARGLVSRLG
jgi:5-methylthioadenosine/S-adenosylhomocysteine deaminase